jgi:hypothetical protein
MITLKNPMFVVYLNRFFFNASKFVNHLLPVKWVSSSMKIGFDRNLFIFKLTM